MKLMWLNTDEEAHINYGINSSITMRCWSMLVRMQWYKPVSDRVSCCEHGINVTQTFGPPMTVTLHDTVTVCLAYSLQHTCGPPTNSLLSQSMHKSVWLSVKHSLFSLLVTDRVYLYWVLRTCSFLDSDLQACNSPLLRAQAYRLDSTHRGDTLAIITLLCTYIHRYIHVCVDCDAGMWDNSAARSTRCSTDSVQHLTTEPSDLPTSGTYC